MNDEEMQVGEPEKTRKVTFSVIGQSASREFPGGTTDEAIGEEFLDWLFISGHACWHEDE